MPLSKHDQRLLDELETQFEGARPTRCRAGNPADCRRVWTAQFAVGASLIVVGLLCATALGVIAAVSGFVVVVVATVCAASTVQTARLRRLSGAIRPPR